MTDILTRLAALAENQQLREEVVTAIKAAPAIRHIEGRHQNALGHVIAEKIGYQVTPESQADAVLKVVGLREASLVALVQEAAAEIQRLKQWRDVALLIGERAESQLAD